MLCCSLNLLSVALQYGDSPGSKALTWALLSLGNGWGRNLRAWLLK